MKTPTLKKIILASGSPRRRQLLKEIVPEFSIAPSRDINEEYPQSIPVEEVAPYLSQLKVEAYRDLVSDDSLVITADTVVILDDMILGKPGDRESAIAMLHNLSGRSHRVITGVTIAGAEKTITFANETLVHFDALSDQEIACYVDDFQPYDKAGAYGIQEWIGARGILRIEGCFYNVMGLPLNDLYNHLKAF